jgi:hypothetical protein
MRRPRPGTRLLLAASAALALLSAGGCYIDIDHDDDCWVTPVARIVDEGEASCIAIWPAYEAEAYVVAVEGHFDYLYFSRFYRQTVACP